jgi:hypothetical protein
MAKTYKCHTCKDDPKGVLGLNQYRPCPDCNDLPMSSAQKDRAAYELNQVLSKPYVKESTPDCENKRSLL